MNLSRRFDQVLQMGPDEHVKYEQLTHKLTQKSSLPREEVAEVIEIAVLLVLDVDDTPTILTSAYRGPVHDHVTLGSHDSERDHVLNACPTPGQHGANA